MNKNELRKQFLLKRQQIPPHFLHEKSQAISQNFFNHFDLRKIKKLHLFLPIIKQNEINTWLIIDQIKQNYPYITPIISKSNFQTYSMESYILHPHTKIVYNKIGLPEPINAIKCPDDTIDMILIPLLCFDKQGFRVGYGKGFYDRFLKKCKKDIIKIGLSFFEPVEKIDDVNKNDVKIDFSVMSDNVWEANL